MDGERKTELMTFDELEVMVRELRADRDKARDWAKSIEMQLEDTERAAKGYANALNELQAECDRLRDALKQIAKGIPTDDDIWIAEQALNPMTDNPHADDLIHTLRGLLASNGDSIDTRYHILSPKESGAIDVAIQIIKKQ